MAFDIGAAGLQGGVDCDDCGQMVFAAGDYIYTQGTWSGSCQIEERLSEVGHLLERLQENAGKDIYPYHMPGHKRRSWGRLPEAWYEMDITEIDATICISRKAFCGMPSGRRPGFMGRRRVFIW